MQDYFRGKFFNVYLSVGNVVVHQVKNWEQAMFVGSRLYELSKKAQGLIIEKYNSCEIQLSVSK